jgi:hypothetical protein
LNRSNPFHVLLALAICLTLSAPPSVQGASGAATEAGRPAEPQIDHISREDIQPPIEINLDVTATENANGESGTADLVLTITPLTESVSVSWEITLPSGLVPMSGQWQGTEAVSMGNQVTKRLTLSVPDGKRYYMYARATLETKSGEVYTRAVSPFIDLGAPDERYPTFIRTDNVRGDVTSFRGIVLKGGAK